MTKINFKSDILPHLVAVIIFFVLTVVFFHPVFLENKELSQHDITQWRGGAQELIEFKEQTGGEGLWTNSMFGGMPAYLIQVAWSGDLLAYVYEISSLGLPVPAKYVFIALLSFYILLVTFKVRPYIAIIGAIAFAFNSFHIISIEAGHNLKVGAIAYIPLVLAGIHIAFNRNLWWGFVISTLGSALHIRMNHLQITYYLLFMILIYGLSQIYLAYKNKELARFFKTSVLLVVGALLAVGASFGKLWTVYEYGQYSTRGPSELTDPTADKSDGLDRDYVFDYSSDKLESMTLLIPNFYGGASQQALDMDSNLAEALRKQGAGAAQIKESISRVPTYWGNQPFTAGAFYAGAIVCFLFVLGIVVVKPEVKYWIIAATVLSLLLSWGKNLEFFNYFMFDYFPGYNKFRAVTMAITIAMVGIPLLGFIGLEKFIELSRSREVLKPLMIALGITGGLTALIALFSGLASFTGGVDSQLASYPQWFLNALREDRESMMRTDALRSLFFIAAFGLVLWLVLKQKVGVTWAIVLSGILVTLDLWVVDRRSLNSDNFKRASSGNTFLKSEADEYILQDTAKHYRVFNLQNPWNEANTSYFHNSIGGYHGAKMGRYQEFISHCISGQTNTLIQNLQQGDMDISQFSALNMLNVKYIIAGNTRNAVIRNEAAAGNAWFAEKIERVSTANEEMDVTCQISSPSTAVVNTAEFPLSEENLSNRGRIDLIEYQPNYLKYESENSSSGLAVFSEIYYPAGWEVTIDGKEASFIRANYILRALEVPAGKHTIEFKFVPDAYFIGNKVMLGSSLVIILLLIGSVIQLFRKKNS